MYPESSLVLYKHSQTDTIASSDLRVHPAHPFSRSFLLFSRKAVPSYTYFIYALPPRPHASSHTFASLYRLCWHSSVSLPCPLLASLTPPIPRLLLATRSRNHSLTSVPPTRPTAKMPRGSRDPREERTPSPSIYMSQPVTEYRNPGPREVSYASRPWAPVYATTHAPAAYAQHQPPAISYTPSHPTANIVSARHPSEPEYTSAHSPVAYAQHRPPATSYTSSHPTANIA